MEINWGFPSLITKQIYIELNNYNDELRQTYDDDIKGLVELKLTISNDGLDDFLKNIRNEVVENDIKKLEEKYIIAKNKSLSLLMKFLQKYPYLNHGIQMGEPFD